MSQGSGPPCLPHQEGQGRRRPQSTLCAAGTGPTVCDSVQSLSGSKTVVEESRLPWLPVGPAWRCQSPAVTLGESLTQRNWLG